MHPTPASVKNEGEAGPSGRAFRLVAGWLGVTVHGLLGVPYLLSGLLAPLWAVVILWTVWTALLAVAIRKRRRRPMLGDHPVHHLPGFSGSTMGWLRFSQLGSLINHPDKLLLVFLSAVTPF